DDNSNENSFVTDFVSVSENTTEISNEIESNSHERYGPKAHTEDLEYIFANDINTNSSYNFKDSNESELDSSKQKSTEIDINDVTNEKDRIELSYEKTDLDLINISNFDNEFTEGNGINEVSNNKTNISDQSKIEKYLTTDIPQNDGVGNFSSQIYDGGKVKEEGSTGDISIEMNDNNASSETTIPGSPTVSNYLLYYTDSKEFVGTSNADLYTKEPTIPQDEPIKGITSLIANDTEENFNSSDLYIITHEEDYNITSKYFLDAEFSEPEKPNSKRVSNQKTNDTAIFFTTERRYDENLSTEVSTSKVPSDSEDISRTSDIHDISWTNNHEIVKEVDTSPQLLLDSNSNEISSSDISEYNIDHASSEELLPHTLINMTSTVMAHTPTEVTSIPNVTKDITESEIKDLIIGSTQEKYMTRSTSVTA
ncbi:unnamed protein product, partial [Meganyctiphanes norvegica]